MSRHKPSARRPKRGSAERHKDTLAEFLALVRAEYWLFVASNGNEDDRALEEARRTLMRRLERLQSGAYRALRLASGITVRGGGP